MTILKATGRPSLRSDSMPERKQPNRLRAVNRPAPRAGSLWAAAFFLHRTPRMSATTELSAKGPLRLDHDAYQKTLARLLCDLRIEPA